MRVALNFNFLKKVSPPPSPPAFSRVSYISGLFRFSR
jgi:hypothetical protein